MVYVYSNYKSMILMALMNIAICCSAEPEQPTQASLHPEVKGAINVLDAWIDGYQAYNRVPGISVGIVHDQKVLWSNGYGYSNVEKQITPDADTIYSICSISKLFTSIGAMQLRDAGKLDLRDAVSEHLDWFNIKQTHPGSDPITIEGLMTHSSGLPRESDYPWTSPPDFPFPTREQIRIKLGQQETLYPPWQHYQYSNLGMALLGEILISQSGEDYQAYVTKHILEPLDLRDTRPYLPEELHGTQMSIGYSGVTREGNRKPLNAFETRGYTPVAGFTTTVNDLAKFSSWQFRLLNSGEKEVLEARTLREMQRAHWFDPVQNATHGLGFGVRYVNKQAWVGHGGGCPGYGTSIRMIPKQNLAAIVMTNAYDGGAELISTNILKTLSPILKKTNTNSNAEVPDFSKFEGNYSLGTWGVEWAIRQWGDQLVAIRFPSTDITTSMFKLAHLGGNKFVRLEGGEHKEPYVFTIGEEDKAESFKYNYISVPRIELN